MKSLEHLKNSRFSLPIEDHNEKYSYSSEYQRLVLLKSRLSDYENDTERFVESISFSKKRNDIKTHNSYSYEEIDIDLLVLSIKKDYNNLNIVFNKALNNYFKDRVLFLNTFTVNNYSYLNLLCNYILDLHKLDIISFFEEKDENSTNTSIDVIERKNFEKIDTEQEEEIDEILSNDEKLLVFNDSIRLSINKDPIYYAGFKPILIPSDKDNILYNSLISYLKERENDDILVLSLLNSFIINFTEETTANSSDTTFEFLFKDIFYNCPFFLREFNYENFSIRLNEVLEEVKEKKITKDKINFFSRFFHNFYEEKKG